MSIALNGDGIISGVSTLTTPLTGVTTVTNLVTTDIAVGTGASVFSPAANTLALGTNGSERVRVDSNGNVGIGTDTPATTNGAVGKLVTVYSSGNNVISGESTAGVGYGLILEGRYDGRSGNERYSQVNLRTDGSNNGQFTVSLAAAGGDVSERANFTINGLTFNGDTAAANALDDYEEGTHTTSATTTGGSITLSSSNDELAYVKIGKLVTVHGRVVVGSVSSPTGSFGLSLPFTSADLTDAAGRAAGSLRLRIVNTGYDVGLFSCSLDESDTTLDIRYGGSADTTDAAPAIKAGTQIWVSITYTSA